MGENSAGNVMLSCGDGVGTGKNLLGWDGDKTCGDGAGMGKTYLLPGGDGDEIVSPRHSLINNAIKCAGFSFT